MPPMTTKQVSKQRSRVETDSIQEQTPRAQQKETESKGEENNPINIQDPIGAQNDQDVQVTPQRKYFHRIPSLSRTPKSPSFMVQKYKDWKDDLEFVAEQGTYWGTVAPHLPNGGLGAYVLEQTEIDQRQAATSCGPCLQQGRKCSGERPACFQCKAVGDVNSSFYDPFARCWYYNNKSSMSDSNTHNNNGKHSGSSIMEENSEARAENLCDGTSNMSMDNEALKVMMQDKTNPNNIPEPPAMISERSTWLAKELFAIDGGQHQASYGAKPMIKAADQRHKDSLVPPFQPANSLSKRKTLRTQKDHLKDAARLLNACNTWTETSDKISVESDKEESEDEEELDTTPISEHKEMIANTYRPWISQKNEKVPLSTCGPPETDLLRAIHFYTSYYYTHVCPSPDIFESMDITSHIAIGMIIQELISDYAYKLGKEYQVCDPNELDGDVLEYLGNISADQDWQSESDDGSIVSSDRESSGLESSENSDGDAEEMNVDIDSNLDDDDLADGIEIESMDVDEKDQERDIEQNNDGYMADFDFSPSVLSLLSSGSRTMFNQDISSSDEDEDNGIVVRTLASSSTVHDQKDDTSEEDMSDEVPEDGDLHLSFTQVSETRLGSTFRFNHHDSSSEDENVRTLATSSVIYDQKDDTSEADMSDEASEDEDLQSSLAQVSETRLESTFQFTNHDSASKDGDERPVARTLESSSVVQVQKDVAPEEDMFDEPLQDEESQSNLTQVSKSRLGSKFRFNNGNSSSEDDDEPTVRTLTSSSAAQDQKDDTSEVYMSDVASEDEDLHLSLTQVSETRLGSTFRFNHHDSSSEDEDRASSSYLVQSQVIQDDSDESSESSAESEEEEDEDEDEDLE